MVDDLSWLPADLDTERPNAARIYDFYLGGAHNLEVDRRLAKQVLEHAPEIPAGAVQNRQFLRRSVKFLANAGIRQFLDLGSGIPTAGNVHEVVQSVDPECRVVYVDHEWIAVAHAELLLERTSNVAVVHEDMRDARRVLNSDAVRKMFDLSQPVAVLMYAVLHFVPDEDAPERIIARYRDACPAGSYLSISHATGDHGRLADAAALYRRSSTPVYIRSKDALQGFADGYTILDPGIVFTPLWRPEDKADIPDDPALAGLYAMVAHKDS